VKTDVLIGSAQVHATLALVDAVRSGTLKVSDGLLELINKRR
jgi:hypothetical protein